MADELDALLERVDDAGLRSELRSHIDRLRRRRQFGLVFESHLPERVRLPDHPVRRGSKVVRRDAPPKESPQDVLRLKGKNAVLAADGEVEEVPYAELVVVAEFGEPIYPGLQRLGSIDRGGDKPAHVVIKGENYHALEALRFSHAGKVDCIYIDPPYNTGARDWKYDNDYVDADDGYRHSKWLAFMERRLRLAKELLKPDDSVLIVTIDEKEYLRLGLLLEQLFVDARIQMVSSVINPGGSTRPREFSRVDEYLYFVFIGEAATNATHDDMLREDDGKPPPVEWHKLIRHGGESCHRPARPGLFYPIYVDRESGKVVGAGEPLPVHQDRSTVKDPTGQIAIWPLFTNGTEATWQLSPPAFREALAKGFVRAGQLRDAERWCTIYYLKSGKIRQIESGEIVVTGRDGQGAVVVEYAAGKKLTYPKTVWNRAAHNATIHGSTFLRSFLPGRRFPYPKSLYAVEDAVRFVVADKPNATILDFFAGSGTTAHAVARLNRQDGGSRQSITVTNNEVSEAEARRLRDEGRRPGDTEWEELGIFEHITRPRIEAAFTGLNYSFAPIVRFELRSAGPKTVIRGTAGIHEVVWGFVLMCYAIALVFMVLVLRSLMIGSLPVLGAAALIAVSLAIIAFVAYVAALGQRVESGNRGTIMEFLRDLLEATPTADSAGETG